MGRKKHHDRPTKFDLIVAKTGGHCFYCGIKLDRKAMTRDHVVPRSKGGGSELGNLVIACDPCNNRKHNKSLDEFRNEHGEGYVFWGEVFGRSTTEVCHDHPDHAAAGPASEPDHRELRPVRSPDHQRQPGLRAVPPSRRSPNHPASPRPRTAAALIGRPDR